MTTKQHGFAGFLDGFKARNIATSASSVSFQFGEMKESASELLDSQRANSAPQESILLLERLIQAITSSPEDFLATGVICGEAIKTLLLISKNNGDPSKLLSEIKMKRLVFHFLEFAELSGDKSIGDLAITIGELF